MSDYEFVVVKFRKKCTLEEFIENYSKEPFVGYVEIPKIVAEDYEGDWADFLHAVGYEFDLHLHKGIVYHVIVKDFNDVGHFVQEISPDLEYTTLVMYYYNGSTGCTYELSEWLYNSLDKHKND